MTPDIGKTYGGGGVGKRREHNSGPGGPKICPANITTLAA